MNAVFADTFYYLALGNPKDAKHGKAMAFARTARQPIVTTAWVITELGDALCSSINRPAFAKLLGMIRATPSLTVIPPDQNLMDRGLALYFARPNKDWSLTDCISFIVMEEQKLYRCSHRGSALHPGRIQRASGMTFSSSHSSSQPSRFRLASRMSLPGSTR